MLLCHYDLKLLGNIGLQGSVTNFLMFCQRLWLAFSEARWRFYYQKATGYEQTGYRAMWPGKSFCTCDYISCFILMKFKSKQTIWNSRPGDLSNAIIGFPILPVLNSCSPRLCLILFLKWVTLVTHFPGIHFS